MTAATASAGALRNVAISVATGQETASMASAATDRRMQPRVCKIRAEIEVSGALTERIEGAKEGAKAEVIEAVAPTESSDGSTSNRRNGGLVRICKAKAIIVGAIRKRRTLTKCPRPNRVLMPRRLDSSCHLSGSLP